MIIQLFKDKTYSGMGAEVGDRDHLPRVCIDKGLVPGSRFLVAYLKDMCKSGATVLLRKVFQCRLGETGVIFAFQTFLSFLDRILKQN